MKRQILGVLAASVAAPYLVGALLFTYAALNDLGSSSQMPLGEILKTSPAILVFGTYGLILFGIPVFAAALAAAFIIHLLKIKSLAWIISVGTMAGLCCGLYIVLPRFESDWIILPSLLPSGAICGWIYWRIAFRQTPKNSHAIDAA